MSSALAAYVLIALAGCDETRGFGFVDGQIRAIVVPFEELKKLPVNIQNASFVLMATAKQTIKINLYVTNVDKDSLGNVVPEKFRGAIRYIGVSKDHYKDVPVSGDTLTVARFEVSDWIFDCVGDRFYLRRSEYINSRGTTVKTYDYPDWMSFLQAPSARGLFEHVPPKSQLAAYSDFACSKSGYKEWHHDWQSLKSWFYKLWNS